MCDAKRFACESFEQIAFQRFARREGDGMNQSIQSIPVVAQILEQLCDLRVIGDIARQHWCAAKILSEIRDAVLEFLALIGKRQCRAFTVRRARDAVGYRAIRQQAGDEDFFVLQQGHECSFSLRVIIPSGRGLTRGGRFGYTGA